MIGPPFYLRPIPCELAESCRRQCLIAAGSAEVPCPTSAPSCPGCSSGGWCSPSASCSVPGWCGRSGPRSRSSSPSPSPSPCCSRATAAWWVFLRNRRAGERLPAGAGAGGPRRHYDDRPLRGPAAVGLPGALRAGGRGLCPPHAAHLGRGHRGAARRRCSWATRSGPGPARPTRRSGRRSWCSTWSSRSSRSWATASARRAWSRRRSPSSSSGCGSRRTTSCGTSGPAC